MSRSRLIFLLFLACACMPAIHLPPPESSARTERPAREVEVCVLVQESVWRPMFTGVREASFEPWNQVIGSVLIRHPAGEVILDPAFGRSIASDLSRASPIARMIIGDERTKTPLVDLMAQAGIEPGEIRYAIVTHTHWDHVGALGDLPNAKVLISKPELEWARTLTRFFEGGVMTHHLARAKARLSRFDFTGPPVDGFAKSFDVFGDGAIVAVPMPGHTPGSTAYFVRSAGKTLFFVGDTSWTTRGIELPAHKTVPTDSDPELVAEQLGILHVLLEHRPDLVIVPAHEGAAWAKLPRCQKR